MALLSNEEILFKQLNLVVQSNNTIPSDFYNFLLHKLTKLFEDKLANGENIDLKTTGSF